MISDFNIDLTLDEIKRRAHVMEAAVDFDPIQTYADEAEAYRMLYSGLDERQTEIYQMLVQKGILPAQE